MASDQKDGKTIESILKQSNNALVSSWSKLGSLVKAYENIEWKEAGAKARDLIEKGKALEYVKEAREAIDPKSSKSDTKSTKAKSTKRDRFSLNYVRLMQIAPELEELLISGEKVIGKSKVTGYRDFHLKFIDRNKRGIYLEIATYRKRGDDLVPNPEMEILVDIDGQTIEALTFRDRNTYEEVYDNYLNPDAVRQKQKKQQNAYLEMWLKKLIKQGHEVEFLEEAVNVQGEKLVVPKLENSGTVEDDSPFEELQDDVEDTVKHWAKLAAVIRDVEGLDQDKSKEKALELKKSAEAEDYVIRAFNRLSQSGINQLFRLNYQKLLRLLPKISKGSIAKMSGVLETDNPKAQKFNMEGMESIGKSVHVLSFQLSKKKRGLLILAVNPKAKKAWVLVRTKAFDNKVDFKEENADLKEKVKANKALGKWLDSIIAKDYQEQRQDPKPKSKKKEEDKWDDDLNNKIPDFEEGKVKLVEAHKKLGIDQKDINWINKHKRGLTLTPVSNMNNKTKSFEADMLQQAMKPGFRISKTGKVYRENRSNRSDLTDQGI